MLVYQSGFLELNMPVKLTKNQKTKTNSSILKQSNSKMIP